MKTILLTGATDGIGLATAQKLFKAGHRLLLHGRTPAKLEKVRHDLSQQCSKTPIETYTADLSQREDVERLVKEMKQNHSRLDILINNAGVFKTPAPRLPSGLDIRFVVNTLAPYVLNASATASHGIVRTGD